MLIFKNYNEYMIRVWKYDENRILVSPFSDSLVYNRSFEDVII